MSVSEDAAEHTDRLYMIAGSVVKDIRITIQALGWHSGGRYLPLRDDISCAAFFYLDKPSCQLPKTGSFDEWELV